MTGARLAAAAAGALLLAACSSKSTGGGGGSSGACLSDKDCRAQGRLCDPKTRACAQCLQASDCGMNADCVAGACVAFESCTNSLDCKAGKVCEIARGRCVTCVADSDCAATFHCVASTCRTSCLSDKDCVAMKQLCDFSTSTCAACIRPTDCGPGKTCSAGACVDSVCTAGKTSCAANMLFTCAADGSAWGSPITCPAECRMTAAGGTCSNGSEAGTLADTDTTAADASASFDLPISNGACGDVIDDMEDGDGYICRGNGRIGQWYTAGSTSVLPDQSVHPVPPAATTPPRAGSVYAMHLTAPAGAGYGAMLGVDLAYDGTVGTAGYGHYDANAYTGITFWARGTFPDPTTGSNGLDVAVACAATTSPSYGGTCGATTSCVDNLVRVYPGADWTQIMVPFAVLTGGGAPFDRSQITHIQFRIPGAPTSAIDLWVDDLALYR
jgi:hypothetical protein